MLSAAPGCLPRPPPSAASTLPHRRRGSRRGGGSGSFRLARCQAQTRQEELPVLKPAEGYLARFDLGGKRPQLGDYFVRLVQPTHMSVTGGQSAIGPRPCGSCLNRPWHQPCRLVEAPQEKMRDAEDPKLRPNIGTRVKA